MAAGCDPGGPILVPLDGSVQAERALAFATPIARRLHQGLCLVQAWGPPNVVADSVFALGAPVATSDTPYLAGAAYEYGAKLSQAYLTDLAYWLETQGIRATWEAKSAFVGRYIREAAESRHASMIVMTSHARAGIGRVFLGSLTDAVVRATGLPVLIVGPRAVPDHLRPLDPRLTVALMGNGILN